MANYEILSTERMKQTYDLNRASPVDYDQNRMYKPGEFPIMRGSLPNVFKNAFSRKPYCSTAMIQEEAEINGYKLPPRESLPYLGSAEDQTNKTKLD